MNRAIQLPLLVLVSLTGLTAQGYRTDGQTVRATTASRPELPIDYVAKYNLAADGTSFVADETASESGYFFYADANERFAHCSIDNVAYHLPSSAEWNGLLSAYYEYGVNFLKEGLIQGEIETISFGDVKYSFASDYYNKGDGVSYALRLCKPSESWDKKFPAAPDNKYRCAYRYERVGMTQTEQEPPVDAYIKISVCYLGEEFTGSISDIASEEWWAERAGQVEECIIPTVGVKVDGKLYNYASGGFYWATDKGKYTTIFFSGISTSQFPDKKTNLCTVRLFKDKPGGDKPQEPTISVTPNAFRIKVDQKLALAKDYYVDITPAEYINMYTVTSSNPSVVSYDPTTKELKGVSVGEAIVTFQINNTKVTQEVAFTVVPKEGELEILHAPISDVQDFPDLSMLTGSVDTDKVRTYETKLGLRIYESTRWDESAHLYVTTKEKVSRTNFNRVNYYYKPKDGGSPYITGQINCIGSLEEAKTSQAFAQWLKLNGFPDPLEVISLNDGSKGLATATKELSLKFWIEKKVFFMIIEPVKKNNAVSTPSTADQQYNVGPIPANDLLYLSGVEAGSSISIYTMDGVVVYQTVGEGADTITIPVASLAEGVYLLQINGKSHRIVITR